MFATADDIHCQRVRHVHTTLATTLSKPGNFSQFDTHILGVLGAPLASYPPACIAVVTQRARPACRGAAEKYV